jgi:hypothetical protein
VANVRLRLVSKLRNEYGIQASFTAAIDYVSNLSTFARTKRAPVRSNYFCCFGRESNQSSN